jgi:hypothetical protein
MDGSLASGTGTVTVAAPSPTMVIPDEDDSLWPGVRPTEPTTPPIGAVRVDAARFVCAAVRSCSAAVMSAWSLRTFACLAASAAPVDRPPDPPAALLEPPELPEEPLLPEEPVLPDEPVEPDRLDEPVAEDPVPVPALPGPATDDVEDPVEELDEACCRASCCWTAVNADA